MAISHFIYEMLSDLTTRGVFQNTRTVCDIGQQNWYGDVTPELIRPVIDTHASKEKRPELQARLEVLLSQYESDNVDEKNGASFGLAEVFFSALFDHEEYLAIDLDGRRGQCVRHDLNLPFEHNRQYDLLLDFGTLEHVFNVAQAFETCHKLTRPGGTMIHLLPCQGQYDHGFFNFHPTFFFDLAAANFYHVVCGILVDDTMIPNTLVDLPNRQHYFHLLEGGEHPQSAQLFFCLRKLPKETPFVVPQQGVYSAKHSYEVARAWKRFSRTIPGEG